MGHLIWTAFGIILAIVAIYSVIEANHIKHNKNK